MTGKEIEKKQKLKPFLFYSQISESLLLPESSLRNGEQRKEHVFVVTGRIANIRPCH